MGKLVGTRHIFTKGDNSMPDTKKPKNVRVQLWEMLILWE